MPQIMTGSWFAKLPARGNSSRGEPRHPPRQRGYHRLRDLDPGPWFKSVSPDQYLTLYGQILDRLDPNAIRDQLLAFGDIPVMLCWEAAHDCHTGSKWCHRHLAAQWLEDHLGIEVEEVGFPEFDRFAYLRKLDIPAPSYRFPSAAARKQRFR